MSSIQSVIMKKVLQLVSPDSYAYDNIIEKKVSMAEFEEANATVSKLKVGDIILTKTQNLMHQLGRVFVNNEYDHVTVVINENQGIHISPPQISRMSLKYVVLPSQNPLVLRLNWSEEMVNKFVVLIHSFIGDKYDWMSLMNIFKDKIISTLSSSNSFVFCVNDLKHHKICTNIVVYCLCRTSQEIDNELKSNIKAYQFNKVGAFLPDDIINLLSKTKSSSIIHETIPSSLSQVPSPTTKIVSLTSMFSFNKPQFLTKAANESIHLAKKFLNLSKRNIRQIQLFITITTTFVTLYKQVGGLQRLQTALKLLLLIRPLGARAVKVFSPKL